MGMKPIPQNTLLSPLDVFQSVEDREACCAQVIDAESMPEPFRRLLVHERDMTSTLEAFYGAHVHLRPLMCREREGMYMRLVVLELDVTNQPVEYGAIQIRLYPFPDKAKELIREARQPLGRILADQIFSYRSRPSCFLTLKATPSMQRELDLDNACVLFARQNIIEQPGGVCVAKVMEILPP